MHSWLGTCPSHRLHAHRPAQAPSGKADSGQQTQVQTQWLRPLPSAGAHLPLSPSHGPAPEPGASRAAGTRPSTPECVLPPCSPLRSSPVLFSFYFHNVEDASLLQMVGKDGKTVKE